ncbi:MAG TPA: isochorismatase family protein [Candidatus Limnocylindrales bacterium]|nr:isochorismatase family protein [Candidatus Limnocylindrales bacterium]
MARLLDRGDSVLVVVDAQPGFLPSAGDPSDDRTNIVARIAWLVRVAAALDVPVVVTEEQPDRNGRTDPAIADHLPPSTPVLTKPVFGLADVPEILAAVDATGRRTAVLVGAETDVCVTHSALGLLDRDYRVAVVVDATSSPGAMHEHGLRRIVEAGGTIIHAKGVYYEWLRTVEAATAFRRAHPELGDPPGFSL